QVSIVGESYLLHDKFVKKDQLDDNDNADVTHLEELLKNILQPLGLEYKRYGNSFVIQPGTEDKKFIRRAEGKRIETQRHGVNSGDQQKVYRLPAMRPLATLFLEKTITGKITDENNEPLPGVNIVLKGTTTGTITDIDGNYRLTVPDDATTLVFSSVGYQT